MSNQIDFKALAAPFDPSKVKWRVGSTTKAGDKGLALAYVDARDIMERLDEVAGHSNWSDSYRDDNGTTMCRLALRIEGEWVAKEDGSGDTAVEAEKGAVSKALVRAAVKWGIGRYLYDLPQVWVRLENRRIARGEASKLEAALPGSIVEVSDDPAPAAHQQAVDRLVGAMRWKESREALDAFVKGAPYQTEVEHLPEGAKAQLREAYKECARAL